MPWGNKFPDMKNDPTYLDGRLSNAETSLADKANQTDVNNALALKANQTDLNTTNTNVTSNTNAIALKADKTYVDGKFGSMGNTKTFKGSCTFAALPSSGNNVDDYWYVTDQSTNYCWNGTSWVNIGNSLNIASGSITSDKTTDVSQFGILVYSSTPMDFDFVNNKITFYPNTNLFFKKARYTIASSANVVIDISSLGNSSTANMYGLFYNKTSNTFNCYDTAQVNSGSLTENDILLATFHKYSNIVSSPSNFTINEAIPLKSGSVTSDKTSDNSMFGLLSYTTKPALFDLANRKITFYANTALIFKRNRYLIANGSDVTIDLSALASTLMYGLFYNRTANTFSLIDTGTISNVTENLILIATFNISTNSVSSPSQILKDNNNFGLLVSSAEFPNFDFVNNQITFFSNTLLVFGKQRYIIASGGVNTVLSISTFATTDQVGVFYNRYSNTFNMYTSSQINSGSVVDTDILIATFNKANKLVFMPGGYQVNGILYGINLPSGSSGSSNRFLNKKANFLGDSITWGYSPADDGSQLANPFPTLVGQTLGLSVVNNYGISGSTIGDLGGGANSPFCERYSSMDSTADLVFILGGTNDWAKNVPLGSITDNTNSTYYGALNILINGLLTMYPTQTIVLATPMHRQGDTVPNGAGSTLNDYRNASIAIGAKYGVAVLDLYATSGFFPDNTTNMNAIAPDGRHPNDIGHVKLANRVSGFLMTV